MVKRVFHAEVNEICLTLSKMIEQNAANYMHIYISWNKILSKLYNMNHNIYTRFERERERKRERDRQTDTENYLPELWVTTL